MPSKKGFSNNILITGSNGFLGRVITKELSKSGSNTIFTLNRKESDYNIDLAIEVPNFNMKFDYVVHSAGLAHFAIKSKIDEEALFDVNFKGTINLLRGFNSNKPLNFIYISSVSVYGLTNGYLVNEDQPTLAKDPYGKSKLLAERVLVAWCKKYEVKLTILRLPLVVDVNPPGNLGEMIKAIRVGYYFNVAGGNARRSMVLASDIAKCILTASEVGGVYNLTDGYHPSYLELSSNISLQFGKFFLPNMPIFLAKILAYFGDQKIIPFPINSNKLNKILSTLTFDDTKAKAAFGWRSTPVLKEFKITSCAK